MSKLKWKIIHESDDEDGNPTQWSTEINHPKYGKYCWIMDSYSNEPLITNEEIEKYNINIYKVLDYCNVYYCG